MAQTENNSKIESQSLNYLSADSSLCDPQTDRLGYAPFARNLADSICKMTFGGAYVIAVYGSWNSGKSTLLNFIAHYLKQKQEFEQPIIVPFNPWLFSGSEDITRCFFDQIQSVLNERKFVPRGWKERIADFAKVVSQIPLPYAQTGGAVATLFDDKQKDASDFKETVEDTLLQEEPRLVVTIDDIDRLDAEEIRKLFRLIKAFPNFTDVVYILFFDKKIVTKALEETPELAGTAYLEKIVQFSFDLPIPDKALLRRLLFEKLNAVFKDTAKELVNQTYWSNVYYQGIDHFITKLSDIVRLINNLSLTYPAVKNEVNPVDLIAIESLRTFCPIMYNIIRENPRAFAGQADTQSSVEQTVNVKSLHNSWIAQLQDEDKEPVIRLLLRLFPKLEVVWGNTYYAVQQEIIWYEQLRVCSLERFPIYFRLVLPESELSTPKMKAILALAQDAKIFGENLVELAKQKLPDGTTQVQAFLEWLENSTEEIPLNCIPSIVQALFDVGDQLLRPEDEACGMFDFGNDIRIERIIWQVLRRLDEPARFDVLQESMSNGNAFSTIVRQVATFSQQQGKYGAEQPSPEEKLLSVQHLQELEKLAAHRLQEAAQQNSLLQAPDLPHILCCWQQWTSEEEVGQWVQKVVTHDDGLIMFLEKFLEKTFSHSGSDVSGKYYQFNQKLLESFLKPSQIIDRAKILAENTELTENQKTAIRQFIKENDTGSSNSETLRE